MNNTHLFLWIVFIFGFGLFAAGGFMVRRDEFAQRKRGAGTPATPASVTWTQAFNDEDRSLDVATRIDMIERLAMLGQPWCIETLERALQEESNSDVHAAAENALLVIKAR